MTAKAPKVSARELAQQQRELQERRRKERRILIAIAVALVVVVVGGGIGLQAWRTNRAPSAVPSAPSTSGPIAVTAGRPLVFGRADAPVTIALYEDFHCPHCADFEEAYGPVLQQAEAAGTAKVEFYPMAFIDDGSKAAANAMACAAETGFGPAYYRGLFANATLAWSDAQLLELADQVADPPGSFSACVTSRKHAGWVSSITETANAAGVTSTPTLIVDGQRVDLTQVTPEALRTQIDQAAR